MLELALRVRGRRPGLGERRPDPGYRPRSHRGVTLYTNKALPNDTACSILDPNTLKKSISGRGRIRAGLIGFQYGAEIASPAPEGTSNSLLLVAGQISGIIFILTMDALKSPSTKSMTGSPLALAGLTGVSIILAARLRESPIRNRPER